uniref:Cell wall protein DAN4-like n=1 Tax=Saccoglossus kowalevskii TaxID=10224 RepID=A0ABM0MEV5_SACKO|nr:PREDICTED: cell wall protein DAN4-like [Saccoglossus kowalevskii]
MHHSIQETLPASTTLGNDQQSLNTITSSEPTQHSSTDILTDGTNLQSTTVLSQNTAILSPTWNPVNTKEITVNYKTEVTQLHHSTQETLPVSTSLGNDQQTLNTITSSEPTQQSSTDIFTAVTDLKNTTVFSHTTGILFPTWSPQNTKQTTANYKTEVTDLHYFTDKTITDILTDVTDLQSTTVLSHNSEIPTSTPYPELTTTSHQTEMTSAPLSTNIGTQSHGTTIPATTIDTHSISNTKYDRRSTHTHYSGNNHHINYSNAYHGQVDLSNINIH